MRSDLAGLQAAMRERWKDVPPDPEPVKPNRKTHCRNGHERLENTYITPYGRRCRVCEQERILRAAVSDDKARAIAHNRRALELGNGGSWTKEEWMILKRQYGYFCVGCWKHESELKALGRTLSPDHIVSIAKGGLNHITNLQPLCHGCRRV